MVKLNVSLLVLSILLTAGIPSHVNCSSFESTGYKECSPSSLENADKASSAEAGTLSLAEGLIGTPYKKGGNTPEEGFNSTGFIQFLFKKTENIILPASPSLLWKQGEPVERSEIKPGDILFFNGSKNLIPAIYKGDDIIIVVATDKTVTERNIAKDTYWSTRYAGARRFTRKIIEGFTVSNPIVKKAEDLLGTPYNPRGETPAEGFNTTNFVRYVFKDTFGIELSAFSARIYEVGESVSKDDLREGDLVFFQGSSLIPGIYKGNDIFIVQTKTDGVAERDIESGYWSRIYAGAKRLTEADISNFHPEKYKEHENPVIREAIKYIGTPYLLGGETIDGFDCSYLVQTVFKDSKMIHLPRTSKKQYEVGETVDYKDRRPGDVIYFSGKGQNKGISHTGIYLGNNYMIHASGDEGKTTISYLGQYWMNRFVGLKRF